MRLKTFQAPTMAEAMRLVRKELGPDAIIVSTRDCGRDGVSITAAIEVPEPAMHFAASRESAGSLDVIAAALDRHGVPRPLADCVLNSATLIETTEPVPMLTGALDLVFDFASLPKELPHPPIMAFGPPGSGKTAVLAKLAARTVVDRIPVTLVTTDMLRAGAVQQIEIYAEKLGIPVKTAEDPTALGRVIGTIPPERRVLIDTTSANPYAGDDMARLAAFAAAAHIDMLFVLDAGRDAFECYDMAEAFRVLNPRWLIASGLDRARRLGGVLAAANTCGAAFCEISATPSIAEGLLPMSPASLARLLLDQSRLSMRQAAPRTALHTNRRRASGWK